MKYDIIIIGSGAAGLSAAIYASRYKMKVLVIGKEFGGETALAGKIENYPGAKSIDGYDLMKVMKEQAEELGVEIKDGEVVKIEKQEKLFTVNTAKENFEGSSVVLTIGSKRRHLGLPNEKELTGKGVHYCWTCDGPLYGNKIVAMIGGGDSSVKGVNFLADYASKLYLIVRNKEITAEPINLEQMKGLKNKVEVLLEREVKELVGDKKLEKIILSSSANKLDELIIDGLFVEIGFDPDKIFAEQLGLDLDEKGYIKTDNMMRTSLQGVFAAGDSVNHFEGFKQTITAAATGAVAATAAYEYFKTLRNTR